MHYAPLQRRPLIQTKLQVGQPNDHFEQEADRVADRVVNNTAQGPNVQRKCADCEKEDLQMKPFSSTGGQAIQRMAAVKEEEEQLQMKSFSSQTPNLQLMGGAEEEEESLQMKSKGGGSAGAGLESQLSQQRGSGQALPGGVQQQMEQGIGADFSKVRIHTNSSAVQMNNQLNARAFTNGADIYFNSGQYQPGQKGGQHLLAHELTHVVQQGHASTPDVQKSDLGWTGTGGRGCNESGNTEWTLVDNGRWEVRNSGCSEFFTDCDGMTCGGAFYYISNLQRGTCETPRQDDGTFADRRWTPTHTTRPDALSPSYRGASNDTPPGYVYDQS